jgi:hypothetical protein
MTRLANFHLYAGGQAGGNPQARTENPQNQRISAPNQLDPSTDTDTHGFEPEGFFVVRPNASHHRTDPGREFVEPDQPGSLVGTAHSIEK